MNLSASGSSTSYGNAGIGAIIPPSLSATGASMSAGHATITALLPLGATTDFGVWAAALPDPAMSLVEAVSAPDSTGRTYLSASIPTQYTTALGTLWNAAATAAVTASFQQGAGKSSAITDIQLERAPDTNLLPPNAADYRDELVYEQNSTFVGGVTSWDAAVTRVQGHAMSGTWCGQLVNNGVLSPYSMRPLTTACTAVLAGAEYIGTVNISLARASAAWIGQLLWYDASFNFISASSSSTQTHPGGLTYQQARVRDVAPSGAAWVAVVPAITPAATGDGEIAYVDCHRIWSLQPSATNAPQPFQPARQQNIVLHANRINYVTNPSMTNDVVGWWSSGGAGGTGIARDGTVGRDAPGSLKMTAVYGVGSTIPMCGTLIQAAGEATPGLIAGHSGQTYTLSAYLQLEPDSPPIQMNAVYGGGGPGAFTVAGPTTDDVEPDANGFYRLWVTTTIPPSACGALMMTFSVPNAAWIANAANVTWWVDDAMVEHSPLLGTYFDATLPSPDYLWEATPFRSRSHYYDNLRFLQYRLTQLLQDALPVGVSYQLLFAQPNT